MQAKAQSSENENDRHYYYDHSNDDTMLVWCQCGVVMVYRQYRA